MRMQDDYLMVLREEQDLQFNREIDEHKEIIQRIYDDKLQEKSEEIEQELTETLTKELKVEIRAELQATLEAEIK